MPRSGSNYLFDIINRNFLDYPSVKYLFYKTSEITNFPVSVSKKNNMKFIECSNNMLAKNHILSFYENDVFNNCFINDTWNKKIFLLRKNVFESVISFEKMSMLKKYAADDYINPRNQNITFSVKSVRKNLDRYLLMWKYFVDLKENYNYDHILYYENLSFNPIIDLKNLNFEIDTHANFENAQRKINYANVNLKNFDDIKEICYSKLKKFQHRGIKNNDGYFELL